MTDDAPTSGKTEAQAQRIYDTLKRAVDEWKRTGNLHDRGDFEQYADDDIDD